MKSKTTAKTLLTAELIAPCGMNCMLCAAYLAYKNNLVEQGIKMTRCTGCRIRRKECAYIKKNCPWGVGRKIKFCFECKTFPCRHLETLDSRYRERYRMSMIENLKAIQARGMETFLKEQEKQWKCKKCGGTICCHNGLCFNCDREKLKQKKHKYRWDEK